MIFLFFALFYLYPLASVLALNDLSAVWQALLEWDTWRITTFTFWQATLSTLATLTLGLPAAYLVGRYRFRGKNLLLALTAIPFVMPTLVVGAGFSALLGERGWLNVALESRYLPRIELSGTLTAIILAHVFYNTTIVIRSVGDYWSHLDPRLAQVAQTLGASPLRLFTRVTLPLLMPIILSASLLVFIFNFTSFGVILILGAGRFNTLEVEIYRQTFAFFDLPRAAALSLVQLICTLALTLLYTRLNARATRTLNLRSANYTQKSLATWRAKIFATFIVVSLFVFLLSPLVALATRSFTRLEADRGQRSNITYGFTLDYYDALFTNEREQAFFVTPVEAIRNSLFYASATMLIALSLGVLYLMPTPKTLTAEYAEKNSLSQNTFQTLLILPLGTSAVTLGLGYLLAFRAWITSPLLIPLAHTVIALPFVMRTLLPTYHAIRPQWRNAAATLGASPLNVWLRIDLPLIGRALIMAGTFAFALSLGEFGATALLTRPDFPTLPIAIYNFIGQPGGLNYGRAMALSTILMFITGISILLIEKFRVKSVGEF